MPQAQDPACRKQRDSSFQCAMGEEEGIGFSCKDRNMKEPLSPQAGGASPHPKVPGDTYKRHLWGAPGEWWVLHWPCALVQAVLVALVVALCVAVAVLSGRLAGKTDVPAAPAPVLACPEGWVGYQRLCYYLSLEEGSWEESQEKCSSLGASLAVLKGRRELEFLLRLKDNVDYWLGLRRRGERLQWVDGSSFKEMFPVRGQGECVYLNDHAFGSTNCLQQRPYVCSKPQALM